MHQAGLRTGLCQRAPCRSALYLRLSHPLRPLLWHGDIPWTKIFNRRFVDGVTLQPSRCLSASEPDPHSVADGIGPGTSSNSQAAMSVSVESAAPAGGATSAAGFLSSAAANGGGLESATYASAVSASTSSPPSPQQQTQVNAGANTSPSNDASCSSPPAAAAAATPSNSFLPPFVQELLAWLASVWSAIQQFPIWVQMQHLRRLRKECDEDPKDADKHATYLAELVRSNPQEVLARVESRRFGVNAAVVAEYLKAVIATGKVEELVKADSAAVATAAAASAAAEAAAAAAGAAPSRTLSDLLRDLQEQLVAAAAAETNAPDSTAAGISASAVGKSGVPLQAAFLMDLPGTSLRRPLHVMVGGLPLQSVATPAAPPANMTSLLQGPLALLWRLVTTALLVLVLALAYIVGSQAIQRVQLRSALLASALPSMSVSVGTASTPSASASPSPPNNSGPSIEPKEYKKDELPEKSLRTFKDVKGCDEAKEELLEVVEFLKNPSKFTRLGAKLPKGVLLSGAPGTGKTLLAKAVAGEADVPFFYRAGSEFEEMYVGVGSRRMRALFAAAKKRAPCIVFIDEIDAIGGNRKSWENHTRKTLNQLLVEMDGFEATEGIIVMAATNLPESLDPALKRPGRFDRQVDVQLPDIKGRRDILEYYLADKPVSEDVDRELLARQTQGFSGADLSNLINEGAILAAREGFDSISQHMLDWAYDKILMGMERKSVKRTLEARRRTAYHEAGHALVAISTPGASPIHKATIVPRGHALGMVTQVGREDEFSMNRQQMLARIRVCMGGTVAEELTFGSDQVSSGATDDLRQATSLARHMVAECGMSAAIGPVYVAAADQRHGGSDVSESTRQRVDAEVSRILTEAKEVVRGLLTERMEDLRTLAEALLDRETLTRADINSLLQCDDQQIPPPQTPRGRGGSGYGVGGSGSDREQPDGEEQPLESDPAPAAAQVAQQGFADQVATEPVVVRSVPLPAAAVVAGGISELGHDSTRSGRTAAATTSTRSSSSRLEPQEGLRPEPEQAAAAGRGSQEPQATAGSLLRAGGNDGKLVLSCRLGAGWRAEADGGQAGDGLSGISGRGSAGRAEADEEGGEGWQEVASTGSPQADVLGEQYIGSGGNGVGGDDDKALWGTRKRALQNGELMPLLLQDDVASDERCRRGGPAGGTDA